MSLTSSELTALLAQPALRPPANVTPDYVDPPNENQLAYFVTTFCMIIATVSFLIRAYTKSCLTKEIHVEEVLMLGAYGAYCGTAYAAYKLIRTPGYYVHEWNMTNGDLVEPLYLILVYGSSYSATLALIKTAILLDWCRIFVPGNRSRSSFWWGSMFIMTLQLTWGIICIVLLSMQCRPHAAIWEFYLPSKCYSSDKVMLASARVQVASDWLMVLLPQKIIWGLKMNRQKKFGFSVLFGVGLLASVSACFRLSTTITFAKEADKMYYIGPLLFWACAEMTCGFFILCVPCISSIIRETARLGIRKAVLGSSYQSSYKPSKSGSADYDETNVPSSKNSHEAYYTTSDSTDLPLNTLKQSESQEHLRLEETRTAMKVMRTTSTIVTSDSRSAQSDGEYNIMGSTKQQLP